METKYYILQSFLVCFGILFIELHVVIFTLTNLSLGSPFNDSFGTFETSIGALACASFAVLMLIIIFLQYICLGDPYYDMGFFQCIGYVSVFSIFVACILLVTLVIQVYNNIGLNGIFADLPPNNSSTVVTFLLSLFQVCCQDFQDISCANNSFPCVADEGLFLRNTLEFDQESTVCLFLAGKSTFEDDATLTRILRSCNNDTAVFVEESFGFFQRHLFINPLIILIGCLLLCIPILCIKFIPICLES